MRRAFSAFTAAREEFAIGRRGLQAQRGLRLTRPSGLTSRSHPYSSSWLAGWLVGGCMEAEGPPRCGCPNPLSARRISGATPRNAPRQGGLPQDGNGSPQRGRVSRKTGGSAATGGTPAGRERLSATERAAPCFPQDGRAGGAATHPLPPCVPRMRLGVVVSCFCRLPCWAGGLVHLPRSPAQQQASHRCPTLLRGQPAGDVPRVSCQARTRGR